MVKEPFVIEVDGELPNLSKGENFEFNKTNFWAETASDQSGMLEEISHKLDIIISLLKEKENGKA